MLLDTLVEYPPSRFVLLRRERCQKLSESVDNCWKNLARVLVDHCLADPDVDSMPTLPEY